MTVKEFREKLLVAFTNITTRMVNAGLPHGETMEKLDTKQIKLVAMGSDGFYYAIDVEDIKITGMTFSNGSLSWYDEGICIVPKGITTPPYNTVLQLQNTP